MMRIKSQLGVAAVEFAIVLPLLAMMMLAVAELGRMLYQYTAVAEVARDGIRYVSKEALDAAEVVNLDRIQTFHIYSVRRETQNLVVYGNTAGTGDPVLPGMSIADVTVSSPAALHVEVRVDYNYQPMIGDSLPTFGIGDPINLRFPLVTAVQMRAH